VVLTPTDKVVSQFAELYAVLGEGRLEGGGVNDQWTAVCALVQDPALPIMTANLADFRKIAEVAPQLQLVHPDLNPSGDD
jgi:predicted nucleic acid-binding protein